jgi:hypothetical protein
MLEMPTALATWSMTTLPLAGQSIEVQQLADHRLAYLDYEGPISRDRGVVRRHAAGTYQAVEKMPGKKVVTLGADAAGSNPWNGKLTLEQLEESSSGDLQRWRLSLASASG